MIQDYPPAIENNSLSWYSPTCAAKNNQDITPVWRIHDTAINNNVKRQATTQYQKYLNTGIQEKKMEVLSLPENLCFQSKFTGPYQERWMQSTQSKSQKGGCSKGQ